jgi:hypothetical protein
MKERRFPILGTSVPPMLGRDATMKRMIASLTKSTPDHLQVVGPRFSGKTVILHELARRLRDAGKPYSAVVLWDLGHQTPGTDSLFMQRLATELSAALVKPHAAYAEHLRHAQDAPYQDIAEVLSALGAENCKVLAIMDGFDKPLSNGQLTRNLWDQLRELAHNPSLRLVTASRRTLRDLIRNPDAQTSDFWNIFDPEPVRIGCFNEDDLNTLLAKLPEIELAAGGRTELWNASNGFPIMMLEILNALRAHKPFIDHEFMRSACEGAYPTTRDKLDALWIDCPPSCRDLFMQVLEQREVACAGGTSADAEMLTERGFVRRTGKKLSHPNRMLTRFLDEQPSEDGALGRLFGPAEAYQKHFKGVLEHRITQISAINPTLHRYLRRAIEDLPEDPTVFMTNVRGIVDQAFELIWAAELSGKAIPSAWMSIWKLNDEQGIREWETTFPQGVRRVRLLNLMTGSNKSKPCARYITKRTYVLMNAAHAFGDFGQHQEGAPVDPGTAYAALNLCVELAASLACELPSSK